MIDHLGVQAADVEASLARDPDGHNVEAVYHGG
jgi:hypothetical protein